MTGDPYSDKVAERSRYEARARQQLEHQRTDAEGLALEGSASFAPPYRAPYLAYEEAIRRIVRPGLDVLELGAGTGVHTRTLVQAGGTVTASDISQAALDVLVRRLGLTTDGRLRSQVVDMEDLRFPDASFDVVVSAGSLSYGDPATVDAGVMRVLRPGGAVVFVDSLNHNPLYRLNRLAHYLRGHRTRSTLVRMPTLSRIQSIARHFQSAEVRFFGSVSWAMPVVARIIGPQRAASVSDALDHLLRVKYSAFKFVMVGQGRR